MKKWVHFPNVTNTNCLSGPKLCFKWQTFKWSQQQQQQQHFNEILRKSFCNTLLDKLACFQSAELSNEPLLVCVCVWRIFLGTLFLHHLYLTLCSKTLHQWEMQHFFFVTECWTLNSEASRSVYCDLSDAWLVPGAVISLSKTSNHIRRITKILNRVGKCDAVVPSYNMN